MSPLWTTDLAGVTRNGAGDYTFTLNRALVSSEVDVRVTQEHAAVRGGTAVDFVDSTHVRVRCVDAANPNAAADPTTLKVTFYKLRY